MKVEEALVDAMAAESKTRTNQRHGYGAARPEEGRAESLFRLAKG
jgi:hypothetical protein